MTINSSGLGCHSFQRMRAQWTLASMQFSGFQTLDFSGLEKVPIALLSRTCEASALRTAFCHLHQPPPALAHLMLSHTPCHSLLHTECRSCSMTAQVLSCYPHALPHLVHSLTLLICQAQVHRSFLSLTFHKLFCIFLPGINDISFLSLLMVLGK